MFKATNKKATFAEKLLADMTPAEMRLWAELSLINIGTKARHVCPWRPQVVIKGWIVDFYNDHDLTAIEVDGTSHEEPGQKAKDAIKDSVLRHFGIRVVRISNSDVFRDPTALVQKLLFGELYKRD